MAPRKDEDQKRRDGDIDEGIYAGTTTGRPSRSGSHNAASHLVPGGGEVTGESRVQAELNPASTANDHEIDPRHGLSGVAGYGTLDARVPPEEDPNLQRAGEDLEDQPEATREAKAS